VERRLPSNGGPSKPALSTHSGVSPFGVEPLSVGVVIPEFAGPFPPPSEGAPMVDCDPSVAALPVVTVEGAALSAGIGTLGPVAFGETPWFGLGVGEPKLSYCSSAAAALLRSRIVARIRKVLVMVRVSLRKYG